MGFRYLNVFFLFCEIWQTYNWRHQVRIESINDDLFRAGTPDNESHDSVLNKNVKPLSPDCLWITGLYESDILLWILCYWGGCIADSFRGKWWLENSGVLLIIWEKYDWQLNIIKGIKIQLIVYKNYWNIRFV